MPSQLPWTLPAPEANWRPGTRRCLAMQIDTQDLISEPEASHYAESSSREKLVEHVFLGELLRGLWRRNIRDLEILQPEVDSGGYDLALEYRGLTRHVQRTHSQRDATR